MPSATPEPSATDTPEPTATVTLEPSATLTVTPAPSATFTATVTTTPTLTATLTVTATVIPASATPVLPSATPTLTLTQTPVPAVVIEPTATGPTPSLVPQVEPPQAGGRFPVEAVIGLLLLGTILGYVVLYVRGAAAVDRYAGGFVVDVCPVCRQGELVVETKQERVLGIPRARRTVRCTHCRSVLREMGDYRWRYAVDPVENPAIYQQYNGQEVDDETLAVLAQQPFQTPDEPQPRPPVVPPSFVVDEDS